VKFNELESIKLLSHALNNDLLIFVFKEKEALSTVQPRNFWSNIYVMSRFLTIGISVASCERNDLCQGLLCINLGTVYLLFKLSHIRAIRHN